MSFYRKYVYKLCSGVEDICCPATDKAWIPCEPQQHEQNEETQDAYLSKGHRPQQAMLFTDHIICSNLLLCLHSPTAPCLLKAGGSHGKKSLCVTSTLTHSLSAVKGFLMLIQVSVTYNQALCIIKLTWIPWRQTAAKAMPVWAWWSCWGRQNRTRTQS